MYFYATYLCSYINMIIYWMGMMHVLQLFPGAWHRIYVDKNSIKNTLVTSFLV